MRHSSPHWWLYQLSTESSTLDLPELGGRLGELPFIAGAANFSKFLPIPRCPGRDLLGLL